MEYPAGWYADPSDETLLRWWDGQAWAPQKQSSLQNDPRMSSTRSAADRREYNYDHRGGNYESRFERDLRTGDPHHNKIGKGKPVYMQRDQNSPDAPSGESSNRVHAVTGENSNRVDARKSSTVTLTLTALFAVSLVLVAAGYVFDVAAIRLAGVLGSMFFGIGAAPLRVLRHARTPTRLAVAVLIGISVPTLLGSVMVLVPVWHPRLLAVVLGAVAAIVHFRGTRDALITMHGSTQRRAGSSTVGSAFNLSVCLSIAGTLLWVGTVAATGRIDPGAGGFLTQISPLWYVGILLVLGGVVLARGKIELSAIIALVSLVGALTITPAYVYGLPRIETAAKHVGFVQQVLGAHYLDRNLGIYQAYSGFFDLNGFVCSIAGVNNSIGLATYWTVIIDIAGLAVFRCFFGNLFRSTYRIYVALVLSFVVDAIGQDYFSPQSVGYVLAFGILGLVVGKEGFEIDRRTQIVLIIISSCALAVTHELSPYVAAVVLAIFAVFRLIRPWYIPVIVIAPAAIWALVNHGVVGGYASIYDLGSLANFAPPKTIAAQGLQRLPIVGEASDALLVGLLVLICLAAVGFWAAVSRRTSWGLFSSSYAWAMVISAGSGLALIIANPYGNEGIFRSALFAIPWLTVLAVSSVSSPAAAWVTTASGFLMIGLTGTYLFSTSALDNANVIRPGDVNAVEYFIKHTSGNAYMIELSYGDTPIRLSTLPESQIIVWPKLTPAGSAVASDPNEADVTGLAKNYVSYASQNGGDIKELYAIWSPSSVDYAVDYGLESLATAEKWRNLMSSNHDWQLVYSNDGTYLFRVLVS
jgi:hypothetical protein